MGEGLLEERPANGRVHRAATPCGQVLVVVEATRDPAELVAHAAAVALATGRRVRLIGRLGRPASDGLPIDPVEQDLRRRAAEARLEGLARAHAVGAQVPSRRVYEHLAPQSVSEPGEPAPIIVFGAHGDGELPWRSDEETRRFVERHCQAVLLVPCREETPSPSGYRRVMLLLDGSRRAEHALPLGIAIARRHAAELLLVHAACEPALFAPEPLDGEALELRHRVRERNRRVAGAYLERLRARQSGAGLALATRLLSGHDARRQLVDAVREDAADLVVIASHGEGGHADVPTGSVAHYVLEHAPVPVLMVTRVIDTPTPALYESPDSHHLRRAGETPTAR